MTWPTLCPQIQVRSEGLQDTMTCLMDHLAERQEEEANFNFIEEKIAQPLIDLGVDITFEQVAALNLWTTLFIVCHLVLSWVNIIDVLTPSVIKTTLMLRCSGVLA